MQSISLNHFRAMIGPYGLYQHATLREPLLSEGYCSDDNTRAVTFLVRLPQELKNKETQNWLNLCWRFLLDAQTEDGSFRNFRDINGRWLDNEGTEDTLARMTTTLASVIKWDTDPTRKKEAYTTLLKLLPHLKKLRYVRGIAEVNIGLSLLPEKIISDEIVGLVQANTEGLIAKFNECSDSSWKWFENEMTYANALLPYGLLAALSIIKPNEQLLNVLNASGRFLISSTIREDNTFCAIGNKGWFKKGMTTPPTFDQQPIEAATMFDFLLAYENHFPNILEKEIIAAPYLWFHGKNALHIPMTDRRHGAGFNGLTPFGLNKNCGAESLLAYLQTELLAMQAPASLHKYFTGRE